MVNFEGWVWWEREKDIYLFYIIYLSVECYEYDYILIF